MILTTEDGREFELNDKEYRQFLVRYGENELVELPEIDINDITVIVIGDKQ